MSDTSLETKVAINEVRTEELTKDVLELDFKVGKLKDIDIENIYSQKIRPLESRVMKLESWHNKQMIYLTLIAGAITTLVSLFKDKFINLIMGA